MFLKEKITYSRRVDLEESLAECLWIEIYVKRSKSFLIGCFYRPPPWVIEISSEKLY